MAHIKVLDSLVADMIAAGEVVERPASVVKELAENAIDAGAGKITVEIKNGGISFLRISDDGCGIEAEDLPTAFLRHATSKISSAEDLFAIGTLGFRGEALASIAAVSKVEVITKPKRQQFGMYVSVRAGQIEDSHEAGCPDGTTFTVRDLFFNQPARMKFLKRDAAEAAAVQDVMIHLALGNPNISFRFLSDGKEKLHTPGDGSLKNCIYQIYGREYAKELAELSYEGDGVNITGFCGTPAIARSTRGYQTFFVNGRLIKSRGMTAALEQAYQDGMMKGKYPFAVVGVRLERSMTDVNVHPAKLEVKFSNEKAVTSAVYWAVKNALHQTSYQPEISLAPEPPAEKELPVREEALVREESSVREEPRVGEESPIKELWGGEELPVRKEQASFAKRQRSRAGAIPEKGVEQPRFAPRWVEPTEKSGKEKEPQPLSPPYQPRLCQPEYIPSREEPEPAPKQQECIVLGQLFCSYIVAQRGDEMLLIDQHAAHERLLFEQLLRQREERSAVTQTLLSPAVLDMTPSEFSTVKEHWELLSSVGFELEEFGEHSLRLRGAPLCEERQDAESLFWETLQAMRNAGERGDTESELLYSVACHAALKANHSLQPIEMEQMVKDVMSLPSTCPHGRPIVITMTKKMIEKQFKRIV